MSTHVAVALVESRILLEIRTRGRALSAAELITLLGSQHASEDVCSAIGRLLDRKELVGSTHADPLPQGGYPVYRFSLPRPITNEPTKGLFDE